MSKYEKILDKLIGTQYDVCEDECNCSDCLFSDECFEKYGINDPTRIETKEDFINVIKNKLVKGIEENE